MSSLRIRPGSSDRASIVPGASGGASGDGSHQQVISDSNTGGFDSRRFQPR